jgi:hypothetical protein
LLPQQYQIIIHFLCQNVCEITTSCYTWSPWLLQRNIQKYIKIVAKKIAEIRRKLEYWTSVFCSIQDSNNRLP